MKNDKHLQKIDIKLLTRSENLYVFKWVQNSYVAFLFLLFFILLLLSFRLFYLQVLTKEKFEDEVELSLNFEKSIIPKRGNFFAQDGQALTSNVDSYNLYLTSDLTEDELLVIKNTLEASDVKTFTNLSDVNTVNSTTTKLANLASSQYLTLLTNVDKDILKKLRFELIEKRQYNYAEQFAHIIGFVSPVGEDDIEAGYSLNDYKGNYKLESSLESYLKGTKGKEVYVDGTKIVVNSKAGYDVYLTINLDWQTKLYDLVKTNSQLLYAAGAGVVVLDTSNGEIKAMVSYPGFDGNKFINGISQNDYDLLLNERAKPLIDKVLATPSTPGSIFKVISSYALLQNDVINADTTYFSNRCITIGQSPFCEFGQYFYGYMDVVRAIYKSSNLFFCENMLNYSRTHSMDDFAGIAQMFGIGEKTDVDVPGELEGNMDSPKYKNEVYGLNWFDGETCNTAIGQGSILVTPIQMASVITTIENEGKFYKPYVVDRIQDISGNRYLESKPEVKKSIPFRADTLDLIKEGLFQVGHNPEGTVYQFIYDTPGNIKVKTGTAETFEQTDYGQVPRSHGWIIATFDYEGKTYAFALLSVYGGGGYYSTSVLRDFVNYIYYK